MNDKQTEIKLPNTPEAKEALKKLQDSKADMHLEQKKEMNDVAARLKKPTV